ncbi:hypothetical protein [Parapedobacter tibetensis]|nr:hypothetical protein [Parapedobacter tibetensis]
MTILTVINHRINYLMMSLLVLAACGKSIDGPNPEPPNEDEPTDYPIKD